MSTGLECAFVKTGGKWYYVLQDWDCPVGAWDWLEYATAYGPFDTEDSAHDHLRNNHANPGGSWSSDYDANGEALGKSLADCIAKAKSPQPPRSPYYYRY